MFLVPGSVLRLLLITPAADYACCCCTASVVIVTILHVTALATGTTPITPAGTTNPWWRVDLGSAKSISQLRVWMRTDALTIMNAGIQFWVSNTTSPLPFQLGSGAVNFPNPFPDPIYSPNILTTTTPIVGRYVWALQQGSNKVVQVCEIQVLAPVAWFWRQLSGQVNLALNKFASSSAVVSGFSYGDPLNVNDGNFATVVRTPNPISQPWVIVDLGATYKVGVNGVVPASGCCVLRPTSEAEKYHLCSPALHLCPPTYQLHHHPSVLSPVCISSFAPNAYPRRSTS